MKRLFVNLLSLAMFLIVCLFTLNVNAQVDSLIYETNDTIFDPVEIEAEFPGGVDSLMMFVYSNLVYPTQAQKEKIEGRVVCTFIVEKDGYISDIKILRSLGYGCDEEAIRIVKLMPNWKPSKQNGKTVSTKFTLPVKFKLDVKNSKDDDSVYTNVDQPAHFPGGDKELADFLVENIKFPNDAADVQGKVYLSFIVEKDGSITNIKVFRGLYRPIDEEAIRVVKLMPKWILGKHNGEIVRQQYTLPIVFQLR